MKRTTSMRGINVDGPWPFDPRNPVSDDELRSPLEGASDGQNMLGSAWNDHRSPAMISPRYHRRDSGDHNRRQEIAPFLRTCGLCSRRLAPGRDIYMYRGDTAFCSEECREQQIKHDERKEKSKRKSKNMENHHNHSDLASESMKHGHFN